METYFDSHVHFSRTDEPGYGLQVQLDRAEAAGVIHMVAVGGSCDLNAAAMQAAEVAPERIQVAIGFDRDQKAEMAAPAAIADAVGRVRRIATSDHRFAAKVCAIGETGLDYHYTPDTREQQIALFRAQCALAAELQVPVIVHSREADADTLAVLRDVPGLRGVLHCFTGNQDFAAELVALGFMISFSGIVTFRTADPLREVAREIPAEHLLIETDAPYLAPVPHRGKRNEPALVVEVARVLAEIRGSTPEQMAALTSANASRLFGMPI